MVAPMVAKKPVVVFAVLALALALRVLHLSSALQSPLSYQPGPDEDYYLRFGGAVAAGHGADSAEFTFMDPGYGYLLGAVFKLIGVNPFAVYLLQALLDTATAGGILVIGRLLDRPRAGLYGALLYGVTSTALLFCATLLKETCVAAFMLWWVAGALALWRTERALAWLAFGVFAGIGVALRSTLLLLGAAAVLLPYFRARAPVPTPDGQGRWRAVTPATQALLVACGLLLSLAPWSLRNERAFGGLSPLPHNSGIVLDQIYNADNPQSAIWIPPFVNYSSPSEIWRGYSAEADRRAARDLSPPQVDRYWRDQAFDFMRDHPAQVLGDIVRKSGLFLSATEIPNNRSAVEERMFSPILQLLPAPAVWLLAFGLVGLAWFAVQDRRWVIVAAPILIAWATFGLFWAEDRFRFHAEPVLALCAGIWIDEVVRRGRTLSRSRMAACGATVVIAALSLYLAALFPAPPVRWDHVVWGYLKMGKIQAAREIATRVSREQPDNGPIIEALGFIAASGHEYREAVDDFQRAIELRPRSYVAHFNLAKSYLALGDRPRAAAEAKTARALNPTADTQALLAEIEAAP